MIVSPGLMHKTGGSGLVHWDDPEGWDGREVGGGFRMGNTRTPMADSCQRMAKPIQYCKVISLQLKSIFLKKPQHSKTKIMASGPIKQGIYMGKKWKQ